MTISVVSLFFASGYAAGQAVARSSQKEKAIGLSSSEQPIGYSKDLLTCAGDLCIQQAAQLMCDRRVGSIVITKDESPQGIVTDTDLRNRVVAQNRPVTDPIASIMSSPVKTIGANFSFSEVLIKMIRSRTHHLLITEDGTDDSRPVGMVSDHDVLMAQNNSPSALIKRLAKEEDPGKWPL